MKLSQASLDAYQALDEHSQNRFITLLVFLKYGAMGKPSEHLPPGHISSFFVLPTLAVNEGRVDMIANEMLDPALSEGIDLGIVVGREPCPEEVEGAHEGLEVFEVAFKSSQIFTYTQSWFDALGLPHEAIQKIFHSMMAPPDDQDLTC